MEIKLDRGRLGEKMNPKVTNLMSVVLFDVLDKLQEVECIELELDMPSRGTRWKLPDGRDPIRRRLYDKIREDQHGNQRFSNDSMYMVTFEERPWGRPDDEDMALLYDYCGNALNHSEGGIDFILFEVCW